MSSRPPIGFPGPPPRLIVEGYELEIRECLGLWARYEGRVIRLARWDTLESVTHRGHYLPDHGPASNGQTFVMARPYWTRSRSRERLEARLRRMLHDKQELDRREQPERIPVGQSGNRRKP